MTKVKYWLRKKAIILGSWEYWPTWVVYTPVSFYLLYLGIKSKAFFFFNAANPGIENGGFLLVSKWKMYLHSKGNLFAETYLITSNTSPAEIAEYSNKIGFPLIAKPDVGVKGNGVKIIHSLDEIHQYLEENEFDFLLQKKINYNNEVGVFYTRKPSQDKGCITGMVKKEFMIITGDGQSTVTDLILENPRYFLQWNKLKSILNKEKLNAVPKIGEKIELMNIGNHARGAKFVSLNHLISAELTEIIDGLSKQYPGFYYGRLDILYDTWEKFIQGKDFAVVEINGAHSEPTHIYDPNNSIFYAWKEITKHWKIMYQISKENHEKGIKYLSIKEGVFLFRKFSKLYNTKNF